MKLVVLLFSTRSPALYVGRVQELGLGAADEDVAELHVIGRVLGEEVVPAILVVIRAALIQIWARMPHMPAAPIQPVFSHSAANVGVRRAQQRRHLLAVEASRELQLVARERLPGEREARPAVAGRGTRDQTLLRLGRGGWSISFTTGKLSMEKKSEGRERERGSRRGPQGEC